ncbi:MAG: hypothetical protein ACPGN3_12700 [Opitutales bacterium]
MSYSLLSPTRRRPADGFALVMSLALIAFLLLIIVSLTSVVRVENNASESENSQVRAQQNALMAMRMALGELQSSMGPDQRVSASAELFNNTDGTRRNAVGVWSSAAVDIGGVAYNKGELMSWLVSDAPDKLANPSGFANYNSSQLNTADSIMLVGPGTIESANGVAADTLDQVYVDTSNSKVFRKNELVGRYAWWVGDENMKARVNLDDGVDENATGREKKHRIVNAVTAFGKSPPFALTGLNSGNLEDALNDYPERVLRLSHVDLLANGNDRTQDGRYFYDLSPFSAGVLANVKNGGLKKDLSLAFEMDDDDFNDSEFAAAHPFSYDPWVSAPHEVASVFLFAESGNGYGLPSFSGPSFTGAANGPTWHLLRDYYTIYHRMDNPMGNPTLDAQTLAPNWNHDTAGYDYSNHTTSGDGDDPNRDGSFQPAFLQSGGPSFVFRGGGVQRDIGTDGFLLAQDLVPEAVTTYGLKYTDSPLLKGQAGDPLRSRLENGNGVGVSVSDFRLPTFVKGNYMPYVRRAVAEIGFRFTADPMDVNNANGNPINYTGAGMLPNTHSLNAKARSAYVFHNPYNVNIRHNNIGSEFAGPTMALDLYELGTTTPIKRYDTRTVSTERVLDNQGQPTNEDTPTEIEVTETDMLDVNVGGNRGFFSHVYTGDGMMSPGAVVMREGQNIQDTSQSGSLILNDFSTATWRNFYFASAGTSALFVPPLLGQVTMAGRPSADNKWLASNATAGSRPLHATTRIQTSLHMASNNSPAAGQELTDHWPMAYALNSISLFPGPAYNSASGDDLLAASYRAPQPGSMLGSSIFGTSDYPWSVSKNLTISDHMTNSRSFGLLTFDFQLRPPGMIAPGGDNFAEIETPYPAFVLSNPLAPIKDNKNIFYPDETRASNNLNGYPGFSPGWELTYGAGFGNGGGTDHRPWADDSGRTDINDGSIENAVFIELPTSPVLSIGKLQHANITLYDHMPALAVGNSFASPFIQRNRVYEVNRNRHDRDRIFYDISYLMNDALWDEYFFSSYSIPYDAQGDDYDPVNDSVEDTFDAAFFASGGSAVPLPNPRMRLNLAEGEDVMDAKIKLFDGSGDSKPSSSPGNIKDAGFHRAAENLMVEGAFNVNSISVDAWVAVLSGARDMDVYQSGASSPDTTTGGEVPFLRVSQPNASKLPNESIIDPLAWTGFRALTQNQIRALATNIVAEIKARANNPSSGGAVTPFLTLSEFVNRRISNDPYGLSGVIQAAIDATVEINGDFEDAIYSLDSSIVDNQTARGFAFKAADNLLDADGGTASSSMTAPTYLLQADILQALGSFLTVRGDTFRIRAFGESIDSENTKKAWCEAIVQRLPEAADKAGARGPDDLDYWSDRDTSGALKRMGRDFIVVDFRWLSENEV